MLAARLYLLAHEKKFPCWKFRMVLPFAGAQSLTRYVLLSAVLLFVLTVNAEGVQFFRTIAKAWWPMGAEFVVLSAYILWIPIIATLFALSKSFKVDRFLGELSYPVYLIHYLVVMLVGVLVSKGVVPASGSGEVSAVASILASVILVVCAIEPFERWRQAKVSGRLDKQPTTGAIAEASAI